MLVHESAHAMGASAAPAQAPASNGAPGTVYFGVNTSRLAEEAVLGKGVTKVDGSGADNSMDGFVKAKDGTKLDLQDPANVRRFLAETLGPKNPNMKKFERLFMGNDNTRDGGALSIGIRDEVAELVQTLAKVERGELDMDRLIMSGHSNGNWLYGESSRQKEEAKAQGLTGDDLESASAAGISYRRMTQLMELFPNARGGVKDLMMSACHTLEGGDYKTDDGAQWKKMFNNLETVWGYDGKSPDYKGGSIQHIQKWLQASKDGDTKAIMKAGDQTGLNATAMQYAD